MRFTCTFLLLLTLLASSTGCHNAAGERVTLWEWWRSRHDSKGEDESQGDHNDSLAVPADADGDDATGTRTDASALTGAASDAAYADTAGPSPNAIHSDALIVNNETISVDDILEPLLPRIEKLSQDSSPKAYYDEVGELVRQQIVETVAQHLIWRRAQSWLDEAMEPQLDKAIDKMEKDRINREFSGSETRYTKYLARHGKTRAEVRQRLRRSIIIDSYLRDHLLPLVPSPRKRELWRYYNAHIDEFSTPAKREMFLIDVPILAFVDRRKPITETALEEATAQARRTILDAAEALKAGETFEAVARKYSHGVNKNRGGAWGFISAPLQGHWAEPSKRLFEMRPSETSDVFEAAKSFFIVKVGKVEGGEVVGFQDAQPRIANVLRQQRFGKLRADFLQEELEQSTIGSLDAFVTEVLKAVPPPKQR